MHHQWLLKPNCSLTPRQLGIAYVALCTASLIVALFFTLQGAWYVLFFSVIEITAVACAFLYYARHATDFEKITLSHDGLMVYRQNGSEVLHVRLNPARTQADLSASGQALVRLKEGDQAISVGRFLSLNRRKQLASELKEQLRLAAMADFRCVSA